jgi:hypothetical protein
MKARSFLGYFLAARFWGTAIESEEFDRRVSNLIH